MTNRKPESYTQNLMMYKANALATRFLCCCLTLFCLTNLVQAQSGRKPAPNQPNQAANNAADDTIKLRAEEVLLNVTVLDSYGHQATDLRKEEFIIAEDMQRQDIASFLISSVPVNVVMLLDASGSVVPEINSLRESATKFVDGLDNKDKISIMEFHTITELIQDWTSNADDLRHAISWRFKPGMVRTTEGNTTYGSTSLYDAIYLASEDQLAKVEGRKAIIILTDGVDTSSKVTFEQALAALIKSGAVVYVVSKARQMINEISRYSGKVGRIFGTAGAASEAIMSLEKAEKLMTQLCVKTGGQIFSPLKDDEMKDVYEKVARELKNQYIITYVPKNDKHDGSLRNVRVFLSRSGYTARSRDSYYSPKDK
ncbi:MAG: VWA domain-containing protein [Acidobacteria bacterium]|nr:VWA domain-containing protein [Acidobacteriota bacterium]